MSHPARPIVVCSLLLLGACGGKGPESTTLPSVPAQVPPAAPVEPPAGGFVLDPAALTLPVPPLANQNNAFPHSGTVTIRVRRGSSFSGPVTLSLDPAQLPAGVRAAFRDATIPAGASEALLDVQAGYADASFRQIYPAMGSRRVPIAASAGPGTPGAAGTLDLDLVEETPDFTLSFFTQVGAMPTRITNLNLRPGAPVELPLRAYWIRGAYTSFGPVSLTLENVPPFLDVALDGQPGNQAQVRLNEPHTLTLLARQGLPAGTCAFDIRAEFQGITHVLPVVATTSPAPFCALPPLASGLTITRGGTLVFPLHLWHDDVFFAPGGAADPIYQGQTLLATAGALPDGLQVAFPDPNPVGRAAAPVVITAGDRLPPGTYAVPVRATRGGVSAALDLEVRVVDPAAPPVCWIQDVEWGQTVLDPALPLVGGKAALLRVQLLADRPGLAAPPVTATIQDASGTTLFSGPLPGPSEVPMALDEGVLASSFTVLVPAGTIQPGMRVTIQAGGQTRTLVPAVAPGTTLDLTVVPVVQQGLQPSLPADAAITGGILAFWPFRDVRLAHRTPYTTQTVLPQPTDPRNLDAWAQLLGEMAALRLADGASATYYGFLHPGITVPFGRATTGIARFGEGVGIGIDASQVARFRNPDPSLDLPVSVLIHELGHTFSLDHAPAGGAGDPQFNYPYDKGSIGTWGFDPATGTVKDPARTYDIMTYAQGPRWVSDWDYRTAMARLGGLGTAPSTASSDQWVVSGWVDADGQPHLAPLVRLACTPCPPEPGELSLVLDTGVATRTIRFAASPVPDLAGGLRTFAFTVPAADELAGVELRAPGALPLARAGKGRLAARALALDNAAGEGTLSVQETGESLRVIWDNAAHPYLNVLHEGARRTSLGLHLKGGAATLPLAGLPEGGRFVLHFSDGLNAVVRTVGR